jgi:hypothetical protein
VQRLKEDHRPLPTTDFSFEYAIEVGKRAFLDEHPVTACEPLRDRGDNILCHPFENRVNDLLRYRVGILFADDEFDPSRILKEYLVCLRLVRMPMASRYAFDSRGGRRFMLSASGAIEFTYLFRKIAW